MDSLSLMSGDRTLVYPSRSTTAQGQYEVTQDAE